MKMKMDGGNIAYMIGFFGAIIMGMLSALNVFGGGMWVTTVLILAGIVIGLMNIAKTEQVPMMVASLVIGGGSAIMSQLPIVGDFLSEILSALGSVFVPAGIVIAFMVVMAKAK